LKAAQRATGGGPSVPPLDEETEKILSTIGDDGEFETKFDSEALLANIGLSWKGHPGTNTLAYYKNS